MPLKLNVGLQKKIGQPDFGSLGASCHLEVEVESTLVRDPDKLREKIRYLFDLAKREVEAELGGQHRHDANGQDTKGQDTKGHNGNGSQRPSNGRPATASQVRAIHAIAAQHHVDLAQRLRSDFGVERPDVLSITDASSFIDQLKSQVGSGGRQ